MEPVSAIVPAAGLSSRMEGPNKLLLPYQDTTVIGAVVRTLVGCGLDVVVVTGRDADEIVEATPPARTVLNPRYPEGLGTSIAIGAKNVPEGNGVLIALGDMPSLRADVVEQLLLAYARDRIVVPRYAEQGDAPSHPVLFGSEFKTLLTQLDGDSGARAILTAHQGQIATVEVTGSLADIDRPSDVQSNRL